MTDIMKELEARAKVSSAWPFEQARALLSRFEKQKEVPDVVRFETGYGPSGLPHMGTFGEVARTSMVLRAFETLAPGVATELVCFSDDMDGLRKVPTNVPHAEILEKHLGEPLTCVPDPFGTHKSFGEHNNAQLRSFLDRFHFSYTFMSATECYKSGMFDEALLRALKVYEEILKVMLPSLREERRASYSPILPICPRTGRVLYVRLEEIHPEVGTVVYRDPDTNEYVEVDVRQGRTKMQWKPDWAMRWVVLGIAYEMSGKDLIDSFKLSAKIARLLGAPPPLGFHYELFLDGEGGKISKSKGNGLSIETWLHYGDDNSLQHFMYASPKQAKRLYWETIPKHIDGYFDDLRRYKEVQDLKAVQDIDDALKNPVFHIHGKDMPSCVAPPVSFLLLLELVKASHAQDEAVLWGFIARYVPGATPATYPILKDLVKYALRYFEDFVVPHLHYRTVNEEELKDLQALSKALRAFEDAHMNAKTSHDEAQGTILYAHDLQTLVYEVGKSSSCESLRAWFQFLYEALLGQSSGPRLGSFIALYGIKETLVLIERAIARTPS